MAAPDAAPAPDAVAGAEVAGLPAKPKRRKAAVAADVPEAAETAGTVAEASAKPKRRTAAKSTEPDADGQVAP